MINKKLQKKIFSTLLILVLAVSNLFLIPPKPVSAASISDTFADTTKINTGSSTNYTVTGGQAKISQAASCWGLSGACDAGCTYSSSSGNTVYTACNLQNCATNNYYYWRGADGGVPGYWSSGPGYWVSYSGSNCTGTLQGYLGVMYWSGGECHGGSADPCVIGNGKRCFEVYGSNTGLYDTTHMWTSPPYTPQCQSGSGTGWSVLTSIRELVCTLVAVTDQNGVVSSSTTKYSSSGSCSGDGSGTCYKLTGSGTYYTGNGGCPSTTCPSGTYYSTSAACSWVTPYNTTSTIQSTNLLTGQTVSGITNFVYNLSAKPAGTTATIQFSQNGTNWYNGNKTTGSGLSETLTTGTNNTITLTGWTAEANFYYKVAFGSDATGTPVLDDVTVNYTSVTLTTVWDHYDDGSKINTGSSSQYQLATSFAKANTYTSGGCWGISGSCDGGCTSSSYASNTVYTGCSLQACSRYEWRNPNGSQPVCYYNDGSEVQTGYSGTGCVTGNELLHYPGGWNCCMGVTCTPATNRCFYVDINTQKQSYTYNSLKVEYGPFPGCLNQTYSASYYPYSATIVELSCTSISYNQGVVSGSTTKYTGSGSCSGDGTGTCYKMTGSGTYYTGNGGCPSSTCSSGTYYTTPTACSWIPASPIYYTSSTIQSANLLTGQSNVTGIDSFVYTLALPSGTGATVQFSQDGATWKNSSGTVGQSNTLTAGTDNTISLTGLTWSGANFYYKLALTGTTAATASLDRIGVRFYTGSMNPPPPNFGYGMDFNCQNTRPMMQMYTTDPSATCLKYKVTYYTDPGYTSVYRVDDQTSSSAGFTGMDGQGGTAYNSSTTATYVAPTPLVVGTQYYVKVEAVNSGNTWSTASTSTLRIGDNPQAPILVYPANGATDVALNPVLKVRAANSAGCDSYKLRYKIKVSTNSSFPDDASTQSYDSTSSVTRWVQPGAKTMGSGYINPFVTPSFKSRFDHNQDVSFSLATPLTEGTTYYWKAWAINPDLLNSWGSPAAYGSFRTAMSSSAAPAKCVTKYDATASSNNMVLTWVNNSTTANQIVVERSVNGGGFSALTTVTPPTATYTDTVTKGNTYQYRVAAKNTSSGIQSVWCTTTTQDLGYVAPTATPTATPTNTPTPTSAPTNTPTPTPVPITAIAAITGTAQVGSVLTAGALTPSEATVSYQWQKADTVGGTYTNISGATASTYTLVTDDAGKFIKVSATGTGSYTGTTTSAATTVVNLYAIGSSNLGGKVAYIDGTGIHGLIAAPSDQSAVWGCYGTIISGADGVAIGTGNQNTIDIMAGCATAGIAARICGDLVLNGYSDWYLPSIDELTQLYINRVAIGGFNGTYYWSSTESWGVNSPPQTYAWFYFVNIGSSTFTKDGTFNVRAVRSF